jgi:hypothetical protein
MARTRKTGVGYFPFDVDFFQDEKIQFVSARFGLKGEAIVTRLLCKIYRDGYYCKFDNDTALLFAKGVGDGGQDSCVKDVVYELLKRGFFDKSIFERFSILTSKGIQSRYFEATKRYKFVPVFEEFLLVDLPKNDNIVINSINASNNKINVDINPNNANMNPQNEREIENEKENERGNKTPTPFSDYSKFDLSFIEEDFRQPFFDWLEYKSALKDKYSSQKSLQACYDKIKELSGGSPDEAIKIIKNCMASNYKGLFVSKSASYGNNSNKQVDDKTAKRKELLAARIVEDFGGEQGSG